MLRALRPLLSLVFWAAYAANAAEPAASTPPISPESLVARQATGDATLLVLDVRSPEEYAAGHVPGAVNVPHDVLESRLASMGELHDHDLVVYCRSGRRAALALETLARHGYTRLWHLSGDMEGWRTAERPVEIEAPPAPPIR